MSDDYNAAEGGVAEGSAPDTGEPGGGQDAGTEAPPSAPPEYLPVDDYAGHHVRVRVDGEDIEVPLSEALAGYSRQADYTQKTQALAEQQRELQYAQTLQRALENNPQATLRLLQDQYGIAPQPAAEDSDDTSWLDDPEDSKFREYDQRLNNFEEWKAEQDLHVALRVLQQQFGDDFDPNAVVHHAMQTGRMDLANIHKELMFDRMFQQQQAQAEAERRRQASDAQRTAAKAGLTAQIGGSASGVQEPTQTGSASSIAEAYQQAKQKLGYT
jgi:hypothetical protein